MVLLRMIPVFQSLVSFPLERKEFSQNILKFSQKFVQFFQNFLRLFSKFSQIILRIFEKISLPGESRFKPLTSSLATLMGDGLLRFFRSVLRCFPAEREREREKREGGRERKKDRKEEGEKERKKSRKITSI